MTVTAENISKRYFRKTGGANHFYAVNALNLKIAGGGVTVLTGRSGSGKTTVLNILAGLTPTCTAWTTGPFPDCGARKSALFPRGAALSIR